MMSKLWHCTHPTCPQQMCQKLSTFHWYRRMDHLKCCLKICHRWQFHCPWKEVQNRCVFTMKICHNRSCSYTIHEMELKSSLVFIFTLFLNDETQWCLCHNDLVQDNCFIVKQRSLFIDWEYSQRNNPWFDLAAIIYYFQLDIRQSMFFLNAYRPTWESKVTKSIYYTSQCALLWADILWHLARSNGEAWPHLENKMDDLKSLAKRLNIDLWGVLFTLFVIPPCLVNKTRYHRAGIPISDKFSPELKSARLLLYLFATTRGFAQ